MAAQTPARPPATPAPRPSCARSANSVSLRVANVLQSLDGDARAVFGTVYPSTATQAATAAEAIHSLRDRPVIQTARNAPVGSVLVALDRARLVKLAASHDAVIELVHAVRPPPEMRSPSAPRPHLTGGKAPSPPSCPLPCQAATPIPAFLARPAHPTASPARRGRSAGPGRRHPPHHPTTRTPARPAQTPTRSAPVPMTGDLIGRPLAERAVPPSSCPCFGLGEDCLVGACHPRAGVGCHSQPTPITLFGAGRAEDG